MVNTFHTEPEGLDNKCLTNLKSAVNCAIGVYAST